jgi:hypothetical protein
MNKISNFTIVFCLLLLCMSLAKAQNPPVSEWTIDLYYKNLTSKHLPILSNYKNRDSLVKEIDYPNKYIILSNDEWNGWGEIVLFEKKGGGHLLAVTQYDCVRKFNYPTYKYAACSGNLKLLEFNGKNWDERNDLLPDLPRLQLYGHFERKMKRLANSDDKLIYELPRQRNDILIKLAGEPVYSLIWNGEKFSGSYVE